MANETIDKREGPKEKGIADCICYIDLLVKVLNEKHHKCLEQVTTLARNIPKQRKEELIRLEKLEDEDLKRNHFYKVVNEINKLRHEIGIDCWGTWGTRIRSAKNRSKHESFKLTLETRLAAHEFLQENKVNIMSEFEMQIVENEKVVGGLTNHKTKKFEDVLSNDFNSSEKGFDDLQAQILLQLSKKHIAQRTVKSEFNKPTVQNIDFSKKLECIKEKINEILSTTATSQRKVEDRVNIISKWPDQSEIHDPLNKILESINELQCLVKR